LECRLCLLASRACTPKGKIMHGAPQDTSELEREIDRLVYQLYDLTAEEIDIVESGRS